MLQVSVNDCSHHQVAQKCKMEMFTAASVVNVTWYAWRI